MQSLWLKIQPMSSIYLDHAATCPCDPLVVEAMRPFFNEQFGNASSPHVFGRQAHKAVESSREAVAAALGAQPQEIIFTSGASESNNHAIAAVARSLKDKGRHIISSAIEHHSVLEPLRRLKEEGFNISYIKPQLDGLINPQEIEGAITPQTILICLQHANNEIGTIQPVEAVGRLCRAKGIALLVDATQTVGHIPVDVKQLNCDFLSLSAHKFYGPQGIGALYIRKGIEWPALILGGDQERGRRAGTHNVPNIVGLGAAINGARHYLSNANEIQLRDQIINGVIPSVSGAQLNGSWQQRLPNNAHFSFEKINGEELVSALDMVGLCVSMGSACTWGQLEPSHVLRAMGLTDAQALGSLRITIGRSTTAADVKYLLEQLTLKVAQLRG